MKQCRLHRVLLISEFHFYVKKKKKLKKKKQKEGIIWELFVNTVLMSDIKDNKYYKSLIIKTTDIKNTKNSVT